MADEQDDIFDKIDAMLGKRAGFSARTPQTVDDFPVLTDVVDADVSALPNWPKPSADALSMPPRMEVPNPETRTATAIPDALESPAIAWPVDDLDRLAALLETRLSPLLMSQLDDIEILIRRVIREELDRRSD